MIIIITKFGGDFKLISTLEIITIRDQNCPAGSGDLSETLYYFSE